MEKKFLSLVESTISRFTNGGILTNDVVKLNSDFKSSNWFKGAPQAVKDAIIKLSVTDKPLRAVGINNQYPSSQPGEQQNRNGVYTVEVAEEIVPGYCDLQNKVFVDAGMLTVSSPYPNGPDIAPSLRKKEKIDLKPVKVDEDEEQVASTRHTQQGDKIKKSETSLPTKNTKIPSVDAKVTYTGMYMPKE